MPKSLEAKIVCENLWELETPPRGHCKDIKGHLLCLNGMYFMNRADSHLPQYSRGIKHANLIMRVSEHSWQKGILQTSIIFRSIFEFNLKCD